jgi:hypothetical protein
MRNPFGFFILLQVLDLATTLIALSMGGCENNPIVAHIMKLGPVGGLLVSKIVVIGLATAGAFLNKERGLRRANVAFCGIVAWNLSVIARLALVA